MHWRRIAVADFNPGRLKLELFCRGARVDESCDLENDTRPVRRTRGGLGSGLDAILPGDVWVNIPIAEPFAKASPYLIAKQNGSYRLLRDDAEVCKLSLPPKPDWYDNTTSSGKRVGEIGVMQGSYFAVYPGEVCGFWTMEPRKNCRFCSVGLCHGTTEAAEKTVRDVVEAVKQARQHESITFVHFNTGYAPEDGGLKAVVPYVRAVKNETGLLVGVQCPPARELALYDEVKQAGADHLSFCFELFDPECFAKVCPGKAEVFGMVAEELRDENDLFLRETEAAATAYLKGTRPHPGQLVFYRALTYCCRLWGKGRVSGEIIAGLEPPERSIAAVNFLAGRGAVATVCVFRPCVGTDLEGEDPPDPEGIAPVFARMYAACVQKRIPIGIAPNIKTAMVHLPQEGRWLCGGDKPKGETLFRLLIMAVRIIFGSLFSLRLWLKAGRGS